MTKSQSRGGRFTNSTVIKWISIVLINGKFNHRLLNVSQHLPLFLEDTSHQKSDSNVKCQLIHIRWAIHPVYIREPNGILRKSKPTIAATEYKILRKLYRIRFTALDHSLNSLNMNRYSIRRRSHQWLCHFVWPWANNWIKDHHVNSIPHILSKIVQDMWIKC